MLAAQVWRLPSTVVRRVGRFGAVEDRGSPRRAIPGSSGYYLFDDTVEGRRPLAVVGRSIEDVQAFLGSNGNRGIENRLVDSSNIYMGYFRYRPERIGRSLLPVNDLAMAGFDAATQLFPVTNVIGAATGNFAVPWLVDKEATSTGGQLAKEALLAAGTVWDYGVKRVWQRSEPPKDAYWCALFSYFAQDGMRKVGRGRYHFGDPNYGGALASLFAA